MSCTACLPGNYSSYSTDSPFTAPSAYQAAIVDVTCSGSCGCSPSSGRSGIISDGSGNYGNNENCQWVLQARGGAGIVSLSFSYFDTESGYDYVTIYECSSSSCSSRQQVARLAGSVSASSSYRSSTGIMQVVFTSDGSVTRGGFQGEWTAGNLGEPISMTCTPCGAGTYASASAATHCADCPAGKYGNTSLGAGKYGNTSLGATTCALCDPGKYQGSTASTTCVMCEAGTYANASAATHCANCQPGKYASTMSATTCTVCAADTYQNASGATACDSCMPNSSSPVGSTDKSACLCHAGFVREASSRCPEGWSHVPGEDTCVRVFSTQADWSTARQLCLDLGGDLACPTNQGQQDFLSQLTTQRAWIGANDRASEGSWKTAGGGCARLHRRMVLWRAKQSEQ